jgi:selenocysteine lyase/cysteine desulfurase
MSFSINELNCLRADTPGCAERIHLNNAGAGLMPAPVLRAITEHLELESRIGGYEAADACAAAIGDAYAAMAALLGCAPRNVAMVENATVAFQQALSAIPFERGDVILTSVNDYISNQLMFLSLARRFGVEVVRAPEAPEGGVDVKALARLVRERRPRLVSLTHVPTNSGLVQPVESVGRVCREHGVWYLVDACQSAGQLPLDVNAIGCDFLSATSRKFLRGPRGAGFLYASDHALAAGLEPLFVDMRGAQWQAADRYQAESTARRFENWEFAYALVLGTGEAARYALGIGIERIAQRTTALAAQLRGQLAAAGLRVLDRGTERCGIVTVAIPGHDAEPFHGELQRRGINSSISRREYAVIDFAQKGVEWALRLSPHYYNTEDELQRAVSTILALSRSR